MKRFIGLFFGVLFLCQGCVLVSDAKYKADEAMWTAKAEASRAWAEQSTRPLASFTTTSGDTFTVNNPNVSQPMAVTGEPNAIVQGADVILNSTVAKIVGGGWAIGYTAGKMQGNYTASGQGSIDVTKDSGNSHIIETGRETDNSVITTDSHDATATPTVVDQPAPVVVQAPDPVIVPGRDPVIVRPQVVNPVVVGGDNE